MKAEMSVQKALNELKLLDARAQKQMRDLPTLYSFREETNPEVALQALTDLIDRRIAIQEAILQSNLNTSITINKDTMSVSKAIILKSSMQTYTAGLQRKLGANVIALAADEQSYMEREDATIVTLLEAAQANGTEFDENAIRATIHKKVQTKFDLKKAAKETSEANDAFLAEVDLALTTSNVQTFIEV